MKFKDSALILSNGLPVSYLELYIERAPSANSNSCSFDFLQMCFSTTITIDFIPLRNLAVVRNVMSGLEKPKTPMVTI